MKIKDLFFAAFIFFGTSMATAAPVVTFTTSGSTGSWLVDFSITNTLGGTNNIYFFGVQAPTTNVVASPTSWNQYQRWNSNSYYGGSSTTYNDVWITNTSSSTAIRPGQTLSGFSTRFNTAFAPTSVGWFAFAFGDTYTGSDHFNHDQNPLFEGIATNVTAVPEPETYAMLMVGLGLLGFTARRRKSTTI